MKRFARCGALAVLALLSASPLYAASQVADAQPITESVAKPAGRYRLEGIMETGSELLLRDDGRFRWYFSYGALDLEAEGRWQREGGNVVLLPDLFRFPPQYPETQFKRMQLRIDGTDLIPAWPWDDGAERGRYVRD